MKKFEEVVDKDPLSLKKYDTGNAAQSKRIYMLLVAIPVLLIITVVFYFLGSISSSVSSSSGLSSVSRTSSSTSSATVDENGDITNTTTFTPPAAVGETITADKTKIANTFAKI